jgi:two-component system sensor histidine kinase UhpB
LAQLRPYGLQGHEERQIALEQALRDLVRQRQQRNDKALDCRLSVALEEVQLPQRLAVAVYRITQEALTNVMRHAEATQVDISVRVDHDAATLSLEVIDNGRGLPEQSTSGGTASTLGTSGIGLAGIRERVLANQGLLSVEPAQPHGLAIKAVFPLSSKAEDALRVQGRDLLRNAAIPALS